MDITLDSLPDEVIRMILVHLSPFTTIALQTTCKRFLDIGHEPLLWKSYCQDAFRWWGQDWHYSELHTDASFIDWRGAFANRHSESRQVTKALDNIIANETGRLDGIEEILKIGYNAKDTLMHLYQSSPSSSNHLAQRYWSHATLGCLHRLVAVEEWLAIKKASMAYSPESTLSYERPLAALDLFILEQNPDGDIEDIFARLNVYVESVRHDHPNIDEMTPRQKAVTVADHLLEKKWVGINGDRHYHSLDHMFLGVSLFSSNRNSVPLISCIIFCYVARAFGLRAAPCSYPLHVHALIQPPLGIDLDGHPFSETANQEPTGQTHLYMDPFNNSDAISQTSLESRIRFIGPTTTAAQTKVYLSAASPRDLTIRTAHNILSSPSHYAGAPLYPINPNLATYAALFSLVLLPTPPTTHPAQLRQHLAVLTQQFLEFFDLDVHLFETRILPLTNSLPDARAYRNLIHSLRDSDRETRTPKYRTTDPRNSDVRYKVGQVFRHRRRQYLAIIYGWDPYCKMQEQWITMNQVDTLPNGRHQPFYNVLVEDESTRYVAEENVVLLQPGEISKEDLIASFPIEIGKWFKAYDEASGIFVSNVKQEYPED